MIDIHSHILDGVDDGARSFEESVEMCRAAARDGVTVIIATPHAHDGVHTTHDPEFLRGKVEALNRELGGSPRVELGCELRFTHDLVRHICETGSAPRLAGSQYALIEFPHRIVPPFSERALFELMGHGIQPVIAHPERNHMLMAEPERFHALVEMGVLGQADAGSFTGQFGKEVQRAARLMLENGLLHFVASDCHNTRNRVPGLSESSRAIAALAGEAYARAMTTDNPAAILENTDIPVRPPAQVPKRRRWWIF